MADASAKAEEKRESGTSRFGCFSVSHFHIVCRSLYGNSSRRARLPRTNIEFERILMGACIIFLVCRQTGCKQQECVNFKRRVRRVHTLVTNSLGDTFSCKRELNMKNQIQLQYISLLFEKNLRNFRDKRIKLCVKIIILLLSHSTIPAWLFEFQWFHKKHISREHYVAPMV